MLKEDELTTRRATLEEIQQAGDRQSDRQADRQEVRSDSDRQTDRWQ